MVHTCFKKGSSNRSQFHLETKAEETEKTDCGHEGMPGGDGTVPDLDGAVSYTGAINSHYLQIPHLQICLCAKHFVVQKSIPAELSRSFVDMCKVAKKFESSDVCVPAGVKGHCTHTCGRFRAIFSHFLCFLLVVLLFKMAQA